MSTGKDYGLPEEYHDWVEVTSDLMKAGDHIRVPILMYMLQPDRTDRTGHYACRPISERVFVAPRPRPTLPDVAVGGIVDYWTREGLHRRVIRTNTSSGWMTSDGFYVRGDDLLIDVNEDGFTVVLEGL